MKRELVNRWWIEIQTNGKLRQKSILKSKSSWIFVEFSILLV